MHRILLIEDDPLVREGLLLVLRMEGLTVTDLDDFEHVGRALNGADEPDLILADWRLPGGLTGADVANQVRRHYGREIPVLIITGESSDTVSSLLREGYSVVRKPAAVADLIKLMANIILRDRRDEPKRNRN